MDKDLANHGLVGGTNTTEVTNPITAGDVLSPKVGFVNGQKVTGTLTLTGDSAVSNVLSGKTFYNTDAKSKQTGAMVNRGAVNITPSGVNQAIPEGYHNGNGVVYDFGSRSLYATGVTASLSTTITEYLDDNVTSHLMYLLRVTGLSFTPKRIVIAPTGASSNNETIVYSSNTFGTNKEGDVLHACKPFSGTGTTDVRSIKENVGGVQVYSGGFDMPVNSSLTNYRWYAYE